MKCPYCNYEDTKVIDSRPTEDGHAIRRRRGCEKCGKRFTTYEKVETLPLMVIKRDNSREPYDRAKVEAGVLLACHKRPVSAENITRLVDRVETKVFTDGEREVPTKMIGQYVMEELLKLLYPKAEPKPIPVPEPPRPVIEKSVTKTPAVQKPVVKKPAAEQPVTEKPVMERPVVSKPVTEKPVPPKPPKPKPRFLLPALLVVLCILSGVFAFLPRNGHSSTISWLYPLFSSTSLR